MRASSQVLLAALAALVVQVVAAQPAVPELRYQPPPNFYRSAITPPEDYSANEFNASLQVYPFGRSAAMSSRRSARPCFANGSIRGTGKRTSPRRRNSGR
jgi:hypothetical protein